MILGWGVKPFINNKDKTGLQNHLIGNYIDWKHSNHPFYYHQNLRLDARR